MKLYSIFRTSRTLCCLEITAGSGQLRTVGRLVVAGERQSGGHTAAQAAGPPALGGRAVEVAGGEGQHRAVHKHVEAGGGGGGRQAGAEAARFAALFSNVGEVAVVLGQAAAFLLKENRTGKVGKDLSSDKSTVQAGSAVIDITLQGFLFRKDGEEKGG
jgi:hypothetical protein